MYDFYGDAEQHHRSQYKHWAAFKRQSPSLAWALLDTSLLGTSGHSWKPLGTLGKLYF